MAEKWFDDMSDDTISPEDEKIYVEALATVKAGLTKGFDFDTASALVDIKDNNLRVAVLDDVLKVIIAEEHFAKNVSLEQISEKLHLTIERIEKARKEMFEDVERSTVDRFYRNGEHGTEH